MRGLNVLFPLLLVLSACGGSLAVDFQHKVKLLVDNLHTNGIPQTTVGLVGKQFIFNSTLDNVVFKGIDTTTVQTADITYGYEMTVQNLVVRELEISGSYQMENDIDDGAIHLSGNGNFSVVLKYVILSFNLEIDSRSLQPIGRKYAYIKNVNVDFSLQDLKVNIDTLFGEGEFNKMMNEYLSEFLYTVVTDPEYKEEMLDAVITLVNEKLIGTTMQDVIYGFFTR